MKSKCAQIILVIVSFFIFGTLLAYGSEAAVQKQKDRLENLVDGYIASCDAKAALHSSRSAKIRRSAERAGSKAAYCKQYRTNLVKDMVENGIEPKAYKVHRFLNEKFGETLSGNTVSPK